MDRIRLLIAGVSGHPETFLQRLIEGLARAGVDVTLASKRKPKMVNSFKVHWIQIPTWSSAIIIRLLRLLWMGLRGFLQSPSNMKWILSKTQFRSWSSIRETLITWSRLFPFAGKEFDIIYFPWNSAAIQYLPLFDRGCPVIVSCRGSQINIAPHNPERYNIRLGLHITFHRAAAVHCVSEAIKNEAMKYGLNPRKAWVIRPAVDPHFFYPANKRDQREKDVFKLISVGSLIWRKGYEYALTAVRLLVDHGVPVYYEIIGDGPERKRVLYTIHDLELDEHVRLVGQLSPRKVRDHLQAADVFVLSSLSEGISNAVLEAMACGLPVVTTDSGGMREAVWNGVEGYVVPVRNPEAMKNALLRLWKNPDLRVEMGVRARKRILHEFTLERQISSFLKLYTTVIQEYRRSN